MGKSAKHRLVFRATRTLVVITVAGLSLVSALLFGSVRSFGASPTTAVLAGALVLCLLAACELFVLRVALESDSILLVSGIRKRRIDRSEIADVSWEAGVGAYLTLIDGSSVELPTTGHNSQGVTNSIRAWLRRTDVRVGAPLRRSP